jgi:FAD/FMN-containing dehydrogenase
VRLSDLQFKMILHELTGIVGHDHVMTAEADRTPYAIDYYWVPRMLIDRGRLPPLPDVVVLPGNVEEVSAVV